MKILFDTSVLVAAVIEPHPLHASAFPWLKKVKSNKIEMIIASHTLAELYAVLTTLPVSPRVTPSMASHLIHNNVETLSKVVSLSAADYSVTIKRMSELGLSGGVIYDALIAKAAQKAGADRILTFNPDDFMRIWPEGVSRIIVPSLS